MTRPTYSDLGRSTLCEGERITAEMIRELLRGMAAVPMAEVDAEIEAKLRAIAAQEGKTDGK